MVKWRVTYRVGAEARTVVVPLPDQHEDAGQARHALEAGELLPWAGFVPGSIVRIERQTE